MARMNVVAAMVPAYQRMVSMLFKPFKFKKWLALGVAASLGGGGGAWFTTRFPGNPFEHNTKYAERALHWISGNIGFAIFAGVVLSILWIFLIWLGSVLRLVYTDQVVKDHCAVKRPFARFKSLGTSLFLWMLGIGFISTSVDYALMLPIYRLGVHVTPGIWRVAAFFISSTLCSIIIGFTNGLIPGVMYARRVRVLEAWRLLLPHLRANIGQAAFYLLLQFAFTIIVILAGFVAAIVLAIPITIIFYLLLFIAAMLVVMVNPGELAWNPATASLTALFGSIFLAFVLYALASLMQPITIFMRTFSLAVLGQMDKSLATIPTGLEPLPRNRQ